MSTGKNAKVASLVLVMLCLLVAYSWACSFDCYEMYESVNMSNDIGRETAEDSALVMWFDYGTGGGTLEDTANACAVRYCSDVTGYCNTTWNNGDHETGSMSTCGAWQQGFLRKICDPDS